MTREPSQTSRAACRSYSDELRNTLRWPRELVNCIKLANHGSKNAKRLLQPQGCRSLFALKWPSYRANGTDGIAFVKLVLVEAAERGASLARSMRPVQRGRKVLAMGSHWSQWKLQEPALEALRHWDR